MATLELQFLDCFQHYPSAALPAKWTDSNAALLVTETLAPFAGEKVCQTGSGSSGQRQAFVAAQYAMAGVKSVIPNLGSNRAIVGFATSADRTPLVLIATTTGALELRTNGFLTSFGTTTIATSPPNQVSSNVYFVAEMACKFAAAGSVSIEVRLNGVRVPSLTTTDWPLSGAHLAGTLNPAAVTLLPASPATFSQLWFNSSNRMGWVHVSTGSSLWKSIATDLTTYSGISDFAGNALRGWLPPDAVTATYPLAAGGWQNGAGTAPASVADASLMDSDSSYIVNTDTATTGDVNDSVGFTYGNTPGSATRILRVQRFLVGRIEAAVSGTIRPYLRNGGTDYQYPADLTLGPSYGIHVMPYTQPPYGGADAIWTPTILNNIESRDALQTLA